MKRYQVHYGPSINDYETSEWFTKSNAMRYARALNDPYVRVDEWEVEKVGPGEYDGDYVNTIYEKKGG